MTTSAPEKRQVIDTEDGYQIVSAYGREGTCTVTVHVPPKDPEVAARNRRSLNAVLARYGYKLAERTEDMPQTASGDAGP